MMVYDERVKKFVRKPYPSKPIGEGKNAGLPRSFAKATNYRKTFSERTTHIGFHKWS